MPRSDTIPIKPTLLTWARQESGYDIARVARRLGVKEEKVLSWERGDRQPTLRQVEEVARFFHRPLSVFFLQQPPQIPPLAADYRHLPKVVPGHESPELRLALRQMLLRRENALNLLGELGQEVPEFRLRARLDEKPEVVGQRLRKELGIDVQTQWSWSNEYRAWNAWRASAENVGVFVFQFSKVPLGEVRGLALLRAPLPVAAINSKEFPESRAYTLLHELVHLMLAFQHEEAPAAKEKRTDRQWQDVEKFAEAAASHALVPEDALRQVVRDFGMSSVTWNINHVRQIAKKFKITPLAAATRLRASGYMDWVAYNAWKAQWDKHVSDHPKKKGGFATPVDKTVGRAGRPFSQLVLEALSMNRITPVEASRYLDLKFEHFDKLRDRLIQGPGEAAVDA